MLTRTVESTAAPVVIDAIQCHRCGSVAGEGADYCDTCGASLALGWGAPPPVPARRRIGGTKWTPNEELQPGELESLQPHTNVSVSNTESTRRSSHSRKLRTRRRVAVVFLVAVLILTSMAGVIAFRTRATLDQVHSLSSIPLQVTDSTLASDGLPSGMIFDTAPARQALETAGISVSDGDSGGLFGDVRDAASDVGDLASGAAVAAGVKDPARDAITILVMGVDARPGAPIDIGVRPDALMVLYLNPETGACRGLAIPRDTLVTLPGYGESKINHALMLAGVPYQQLVVEQFLDLEIDHYALIDFAGFQTLVDAVGGVQVTVPSDIEVGDTIAFSAGPQMLDGDEALAYARYRGGDDGDVGRVRRQQQIVRGLANASSGRNITSEIDRLLPAVADHVRTDLGASDLVALMEIYKSTCSDSNLELDALQGTIYQPETPDPIFQQPIDYVRVDEAVVTEKVADLTRL